jgi:hypothetical protein
MDTVFITNQCTKGLREQKFNIQEKVAKSIVFSIGDIINKPFSSVDKYTVVRFAK